MKIKLIFVIFAISIFSFAWGIGSGVYKWFPYFYLLEAKKIFTPSQNKDISEDVLLDRSEILDRTKNIEIESVLTVRENLKKKIIHKIESSDINIQPINNNSDKISVNIYNNEIKAIMTYASKSKDCLRIYIQGHGVILFIILIIINY